MGRHVQFPKRAVLPASSTVAPMAAYRALGITRMTARRWRGVYAMPGAPERGAGINTAALAAWLTERGCRVDWR